MILKRYTPLLLLALVSSCGSTPSLNQPSSPKNQNNNTKLAGLLANSNTVAVKSTFFNRPGQQRLYLLKDKGVELYIDALTGQYLSVNRAFFKQDEYNRFVKSFNININGAMEAERFVSEFNRLFLNREFVTDKEDLKKRFVDDNGLIGSISTLTTISPLANAEGFQLMFYTTDELALYRNSISLTKQALFVIYRVEKLELTLPHAD